MKDPIEAIREALAAAAEAHPHDATRAALATADAGGRPSVRYVLVKGVDARGVVFYTHRDSRKGRELEANPRAALAMHWWETGTQVRVGGAVELVSDDEADAYFGSRERGSQVGAWASAQSEVIESRDALLARVSEAEARFEGKPVPRPPRWGGYRIVPDEIELWQNGEHRLHDRFRYVRDGETWSRQRLMP